ncbi:MAG: class I SAM-dependent methyltransferase [Alphaproteobacteria bacterium]|nr:class I SAM-dependent methyltransferase [Alphaproteobacteria bacterium]
MAGPNDKEIWVVGEVYERYVGRWSRPVGRVFIDWLDMRTGLRWADIGCGTGALVTIVLDRAGPSAVAGVDMSDGFLTLAREQVKDARVAFECGDAQALPLGDASVDVAISGLVLNFVPDPAQGLREMRRIVRPGGTVALYVWDYQEGMQFMRCFWDAAAALDPAAAALDEGKRFPICNPEPLTDLFDAVGLQAVDSRAIDVPTHFADFGDFWTPFLGGQGPAPTYCMGLPEPRRESLRRRLADILPTESDGRIHLSARAWAVRGTVPGSC